MSKQIFPVDIIENSSEKLIKDNHVSTKIIYTIVLVVILIVFVLSFFIKVDVNVIALGIAKSPGERVIINSPYSAFVDDIYVRENNKVRAGDTILLLNADQIQNERSKYSNRLNEVSDYIRDLQYLIGIDMKEVNGSNLPLLSPAYRKSLSYYKSQFFELQTRFQSVSDSYIRNKKLFEYGDISKAEFEKNKAEYDNSRIAMDLLANRQMSEWQSELDRYIMEHRELSTHIKQLKLEHKESVVSSPVAGIIQRIEGIDRGSYVQQGQKLFEISIDRQLYAECLIPPKDIGYIQADQKVMMQVDAFNYNEWGSLSGEVVEIFNDVTLVESGDGVRPFFKVLCSIDRPYLTLKNGYKGELKRGMTMNCRFVVTKRTIFQLLYDKVDDWINPNMRNN